MFVFESEGVETLHHQRVFKGEREGAERIFGGATRIPVFRVAG